MLNLQQPLLPPLISLSMFLEPSKITEKSLPVAISDNILIPSIALVFPAALDPISIVKFSNSNLLFSITFVIYGMQVVTTVSYQSYTDKISINTSNLSKKLC